SHPVRVNGRLVPRGDVLGFAFASAERVLYLADQDLDQRFELYSFQGLTPRSARSAGSGPAALVRRLKLNGPAGPGAGVRHGYALDAGGTHVLFTTGRANQDRLFLARTDRSGTAVDLGVAPAHVLDYRFAADGARFVYLTTAGLYSRPRDLSQPGLRLDG